MTTMSEYYNRHGEYVQHGGRYVSSRPSMVGLTLDRDWSKLHLTPFKPPARKAFAPQLGEIGSWVTLPDGSEWQVWALSPREGYVWIANGRAFEEMSVRSLTNGK